MIAKLRTGIVFLCFLFLASMQNAPEIKANTISSIKIYVDISKEGKAFVTETWEANVTEGTEGYRPYGNLNRCGITDFQVTDDTGRLYDTLPNWNVSGTFSDKAGKCGIRRTGDGMELCFGITEYGYRTYYLSYEISNIINDYNGEQGLYFSFIPEKMDQSPEFAEVRISAPENLSYSSAEIFGYGYEGTVLFEEGDVVFRTDGRLPKDDYMTALIHFKNNPFEHTIAQNKSFEEQHKEADDDSTPYKSSALDYILPAVFVAFLVISWILWYLYGVDDPTVEVMEFYPPEGMNSAEMAFAYKGRLNREDVFSLLVYMASRGYIRIEETEENSIFSFVKEPEFIILKEKEYEGENIYEKMFMNALFGAKTMVTKYDLNESFYTKADAICKIMNSRRNREMLFEPTSLKMGTPVIAMMAASILMLFGRFMSASNISPTTVPTLIVALVGIFIVSSTLLSKNRDLFSKIFVVFWGIGFTGAPLAVTFADFRKYPGIAKFNLAVCAVCMVGMAVALAFMKKRTAFGQKLYNHILGFKKFLEVAEKNKLESMAAENPTYFYDILAYTYVLGVSDAWFKKYDHIASAPPSWYTARGGYSPSHFSHSMHSTMRSVSRSMTSTGGGGGSSHGGGHGGGGHSSGGGFR